MKKTFNLTHEKIKYERRVDAVKHEVKKYLKRERNKQLPKGADYWDFDCRFGQTQDDAKTIHVKEINKSIDSIVTLELTSFYLEVLAFPAVRKTSVEDADDFDDEDEFDEAD